MKKRNIKTKRKNYKGSITVFAALSFMLIAQFIFTMLEVSRTIEVRKALQMNTESVLESIFANYCSPLWEEYRLLGTSVVNSDGDLSFNNVQAELQNLTEVNLGGREKSLLAGTSLLTAKMTDANFEEIRKYIRFVEGKILLGEVGNELELQIANNRISFLQSNAEVAYFSNNKLYVTDGEYTNSLRLGQFAFLPRENGNLSFKKLT